MPYLHALLICGGAAVYTASRLLKPVYVARPELLLDSVSLLIPPGLYAAAFWGVLIFLAAWIVESMLYRFALRLPWKTVWAESFRSYAPLAFLLVFALLFFPGTPGVPLVGWWLLLDASPWILTLVGAVALHRKVSFVVGQKRGIPWLRGAAKASGATFLFAIALLSVLVAMTPDRRFTEPYDARWGTGDEPRYVRIAASLLHDGDADIANAGAHISRESEPLRFMSHVMGWPGATLSTIGDVVSSLWAESPDQASRLGGQVIRGKDGGTYYVYLPGFPLIVVPAMALDAVFFPGMLPLVLLTCLIVGVMTAIAIARLVEPYLESRIDSYLMIAAVSLTLPMFFYHFQIYPEMTAALCLALMLKALLDENLGRSGAIVFGLAASLLPWLHTRYYPVLGVCILALIYRTWRDRVHWRTSGWALSLPSISVALQCLYIFHITGSLLPDTLWVLNGYPRGGHLFNSQAFSGLYYLLLGREEGLLVYAPLYLLAVPGVVALWRKSTFAACLSLAVFVPYLWVSASHDQGGAGGWSPATRYLVPVTPVLALWLAAWLGQPQFRRARWSGFFVGAAASFWIAQGMLVERNFPYDRNAFLSSGVLSVSAGLGSVPEADPLSTLILYPILLVLLLAVVLLWERRGEKASPGGLAIAIVSLLLVTGVTTEAWTVREEWISPRSMAGATRLRPERATLVELPVCQIGSPRLRFIGAEGSHALSVRGDGFERHLVVPPTAETEIEVAVVPIRRVMRGGSEAIALVRIELEAGQMPLRVEPFCR